MRHELRYTLRMGTPRHLAHVAPPVFTVDICISAGSEVLMFKRSQTKKAFPGWLALPGGHIEEGENPLDAAIREVTEETGIALGAGSMELRFVAFHHHLDRKELYVVFGYRARLSRKPERMAVTAEGNAVWIDRDVLLKLDTVFPPVRYYLPRLLGEEPGVLYNYSEWDNALLVGVRSEHSDRNY